MFFSAAPDDAPFTGYDLPVFTGDVCDPSVTIPKQFQSYCAVVSKTQNNISPLYRLDSFDWTILVLYFSILFVLSVYGLYRVKQVIEFWRYRHIVPQPQGRFS